MGYSPQRHKRVRYDLATNQHQQENQYETFSGSQPLRLDILWTTTAKVSVQILWPFFSQIVLCFCFLPLSCMNFLSILAILNPFSDIWFTIFFFYSIGCLVILIASFALKKIFSLMKQQQTHLFIFAIVDCAWCVIFKKYIYCQDQCQEVLPLCFLPVLLWFQVSYSSV